MNIKHFYLFCFICSHSKHTFLGNFSVKALKVRCGGVIIKAVDRTEHCPLITLSVPVGPQRGKQGSRRHPFANMP